MSLIIVPGSNFYYRYNGTEGTETIYEDPEDPESTKIVELDQDNEYLRFYTGALSSSYEAYIYCKYPNGENIAPYKQIWANIRSSVVPSSFDTFELYLEDGNGKKATLKLYDTDMGIKKMFILESLVRETGFNDTFVTCIGIHFKSCSDSSITSLIAVIDDLTMNSASTPHYCQPQDVANFLGMTNNDGSPMIISDTSPITYETLADIICQAEDYIEQETRTSFTERRCEEEIRDLSSSSSLNSMTNVPYMGLFQPSCMFSPATAWFRGYWIQLVHKDILPLDKDKGDKLEIRWAGHDWRDKTPTKGDISTVWCDPKKGGLYIRDYFIQRDASIRVSYRYGQKTVPGTIKRVALLFCAKHILESRQLYTFLFPEAGDYENRWHETAISYEYQMKNLLRAYVDQTVIGGL